MSNTYDEIKELRNQYKKDENKIRNRLSRRGYRLITTTNVPYYQKTYAIVDASTNFVVSGERMFIGQVEGWLNS